MGSLIRDILDELKASDEDLKTGRNEYVKSRNAIIASAIVLCPATVFFVLLAMIINGKIAIMPDFLFAVCLAYPLVGLGGLAIGLIAHGRGHYATVTVSVIMVPAFNVLIILAGFVWWGL